MNNQPAFFWVFSAGRACPLGLREGSPFSIKATAKSFCLFLLYESVFFSPALSKHRLPWRCCKGFMKMAAAP